MWQGASNILFGKTPADWHLHTRAAVVCLVALLGAIAVQWLLPEVAVYFFLVSFIAGIWYSGPETLRSIADHELDVDFLMILVAGGAWALGHPEEGAALLVLFSASRAMEAYARQRTRSSIDALTQELPRRAMIEGDGKREEISVDDVVVGQTLVVRPGERVALDGVILDGRSALDLSMITGESAPQETKPGMEVPSGALNGQGLLRLRVLRPATESAYQKIIALIENAPARRSPAQVLSDRIGKYFTWTILSVSALGCLYWYAIAGLGFSEAAYRAMALLVAGSPCAIVLSIPSAILAAIASGARRGVLFNGGVGLSSLANVQAVAFDKTGTLSAGIPGVVKISGDGAGDPEALALAAALAHSSTHPASQSIVRYFNEHLPESPAPLLEEVREQAGRGMTTRWNGKRVELGRARGCDLFDEEDRELSRVLLYVDGRPLLRIYMSETPRECATEAVAALHQMKLATMIISGDVQAAVNRLAAMVGIEDARGELSPEDKWRIIRDENARRPIMMVGDGVNDAPALAEATVGVAMGVRGSAATLAQADIVLVKDRLADLVGAVRLGYRTRTIIRQNLTIAIGAAAIMICFALAGSLPLALGVFGHEGGTVLVVLNSLRLLRAENNHLVPAPDKATESHTLATPAAV